MRIKFQTNNLTQQSGTLVPKCKKIPDAECRTRVLTGFIGAYWHDAIKDESLAVVGHELGTAQFGAGFGVANGRRRHRITL